MAIPALAADSGWESPTANTVIIGGDGNGFETNPTRVYSNDTDYAYNDNFNLTFAE